MTAHELREALKKRIPGFDDDLYLNELNRAYRELWREIIAADPSFFRCSATFTVSDAGTDFDLLFNNTANMSAPVSPALEKVIRVRVRPDDEVVSVTPEHGCFGNESSGDDGGGGGGGGGESCDVCGHVIQDEGSGLTQRDNLDFRGDSVAATDTGTASRVTVGVAVMNEGSNLAVRNRLNFIGDGVDAVDNSGANRTDITITRATFVINGLNPDVKGGIIGAEGGGGRPAFCGGSAGNFVEPAPLPLLLGPMVLSIDDDVPNGFYSEHWISRITASGSLSTTPILDVLSAIRFGHLQGGVVNGIGFSPFAQGEAHQSNALTIGPTGPNITGWAAEIRGIPYQWMVVPTIATQAAGTTWYSQPFHGGANSSAVQTRHPITGDGTISNAIVHTTTSQSGGGDLVITLQVNNVDTSMVITIPAGAASGKYLQDNDAVTVSVSEGDYINWKIVNNGVAGSTPLHGLGCLFQFTDPDTDTAIIPFPNPTIANAISGDFDQYMSAYHGQSADINEIDAQRPLPRAGTGKNLKIYAITAPDQDTVLTVMKNGVATSMTVTVPAATTGLIAGTGTATFAAGDCISLKWHSGAGPTQLQYSAAAFTFEEL